MKEIMFENNPIFLGDIWEKLDFFLLKNYYLSKKFILVDENTIKDCFPFIGNFHQLSRSQIIQIKSGEENKNIETVKNIWNKLVCFEADRKSLLINLGGGVISDLGGFAASTFKRGIDFINIPTTLLSQVDASIGGKTGIDFISNENTLLKNQIGVFNNPKAIFIFPGFLKTLNQREVLSGFAEVIKHALIHDGNYWNEIRNLSFQFEFLSKYENLQKIILGSLKIKNEIVSKDPKENGLRKILNFGHTIGHALESYSLKNDKNPLLHGEAVAIGMICETYISNKVSGLKSKELIEISSFIRGKYNPYEMDKKEFNILISLMNADKKNENSLINFSLLTEIGKSTINQHCSDSIILESLNFYFEPS